MERKLCVCMYMYVYVCVESALKHTLRAFNFWFRIEVQFKGYPPPIISWYRDNFEIHPSHDFQVKAQFLSHMILSPEY